MALAVAAVAPSTARAAGAAPQEPPAEPSVVYPGNLLIEQLHQQFDRDKSGLLEPAERDAAQSWLLGRYDTNRDGRLEPQELRSLLPAPPPRSDQPTKKSVRSAAPKSREARQATQPRQGSAAAASSPDAANLELGQSIAETLQALDTNGDGQLDAAERRKAEAYLRRLRSRGSATKSPQSPRAER
jgi:hypothetical protein